MRAMALITALLAVSCSSDPEPAPKPALKSAPRTAVVDPFCGDGNCDEWRGEDAWWCVDCGFDPLTGGPRDGGYCGDSHYFGNEDMRSCWRDYRPVPFNPFVDPRDPGWIDPMPDPWRQNMVVRVVKDGRTGDRYTWLILGPSGPLTSFDMPVDSEPQDIEEAAWEAVPEPNRVEELILQE